MKSHPAVLAFAFCFVVSISFAQTPELVLPVGHTDQVSSVQFSPDGKYVVSTSSDKTAKIWAVSSGKLLHSLEGHAGVISALFSPDGKYIVTVSQSYFGIAPAKIWETNSGKLLHSIEGTVNTAQFSPDGKYIVTADEDGTAKIWEINSGKLLRTLQVHEDAVNSAQFSPDGNFIVTASGFMGDRTVKIWKTNSGQLIHSLERISDDLPKAEFSPDGKYIIITARAKTAQIWEANSGRMLHSLEGHSGEVQSAKFSSDGKYIVTASDDNTAKIWETISGKLLHSLEAHTGSLDLAQFSSDGKYIVTASHDNTGKIWETNSGKLLHSLEGHNDWVRSAQFSPDGKYIATGSRDNTAKIWEANSGKLLHSMEGHSVNFSMAKFSPDGKYIVAASTSSETAKIFAVSSGKLLYSLKGRIESAQFSPDGKYIVTSGAFMYQEDARDSTAKIWETISGRLLHSLKGHSAQFSPDGKYIVTASYDKTAQIWEFNTGKILHLLKGHTANISSAQFSPDGKYIITAGTNSTEGVDKTVKIWEANSGTLLHSLDEFSGNVDPEFSSDSKYIIASFSDNTAKIWEASSCKLIHSLEGHRGWVNSAKFSPDAKYIITTGWERTAKIWEAKSGKLMDSIELQQPGFWSAQFSPDSKYIFAALNVIVKLWNASSLELLQDIEIMGDVSDINTSWPRILTIKNSGLFLYDLKTGKEIISWVGVGSKDWVITHPSGLFDASPGAMDKLYFVQGLDIIDFNQLKERYYEPGLWKKVMAGEQLRNVVGMKSIELPPDIQVGQVDGEGYLNINLTNRGGGIGEVNLFVNGKEVIKDARDANIKPDAPNASIKVFVGKHKSIVKGQENLIAVKAWNKDHWVQSRGQVVTYQSKEIENYKPAIHILSCGVSDYTGNEIDLKYAAKDANDVSVALQLGAKKLFGAERSYVYNLTTSQPKEFYPTKTNILKAFEKISSTAHPLDIFVMYVSGHGINYGGQDGDWHYLTQEAYTGSGAAYNDPAIRAQTTISSNELVELFKKVPALKQVLMLDACASGKVVDNLMAQKDIESSTLRALDRMRDRTGMHIITGCTADAVSYEASKYGQGVLTYSLLEGIRGAALREDQYVDVNKLFQYAQDRVPQLAEGIGGIQSPQVFSPQGSQSFDIGLLSDVEKKEIPIAKIRPVFVRSNFQDENELEDVLGLGKLINESLNEVSSKGIDSQIIFVDVADYPEGCKLIGRYKKENGKIILKLRRKCGGEDKTYDLKADNVEGLKVEILKVL